MITLAMLSVFSDPDPHLFAESHGVVLSCTYSGDEAIIVTDYSSISSVVAMVPHRPPGWNMESNRYFVVEKPGLDVADLSGIMQEGLGDDECEDDAAAGL